MASSDTEDLDIYLRHGRPWPAGTEAALRAYDLAIRLQRITRMLDACLLAAWVARAYRELPWLYSFGFEVSSKHSGEPGEMWVRVPTSRVIDVKPLANAQLPLELVRDGAFDGQAAAKQVESYLGGSEEQAYELVGEQLEDEPRAIWFHRDSIAELLDRELISGREAFIRLCPELRHHVEGDDLDLP